MEELVYDVEQKNEIFLVCCWLLFSNFCFPAEHAEKSLTYDTNGNISKYIAPHAGEISYSYDPIKRLTEIRYSNGLVSKRSYDNRSRLIELSEMGRTIQYTYDERDRITKISSPFGEISYSYDQKGNVLSKTDHLGLTSTFKYDESDNLIQATDALGGVSSYEYNSFGDFIRIILPNGSIREIRYDEFERPVALK